MIATNASQGIAVRETFPVARTSDEVRALIDTLPGVFTRGFSDAVKAKAVRLYPATQIDEYGEIATVHSPASGRYRTLDGYGNCDCCADIRREQMRCWHKLARAMRRADLDRQPVSRTASPRRGGAAWDVIDEFAVCGSVARWVIGRGLSLGDADALVRRCRAAGFPGVTRTLSGQGAT